MVLDGFGPGFFGWRKLLDEASCLRGCAAMITVISSCELQAVREEGVSEQRNQGINKDKMEPHDKMKDIYWICLRHGGMGAWLD